MRRGRRGGAGGRRSPRTLSSRASLYRVPCTRCALGREVTAAWRGLLGSSLSCGRLVMMPPRLPAHFGSRSHEELTLVSATLDGYRYRHTGAPTKSLSLSLLNNVVLSSHARIPISKAVSSHLSSSSPLLSSPASCPQPFPSRGVASAKHRCNPYDPAALARWSDVRACMRAHSQNARWAPTSVPSPRSSPEGVDHPTAAL